MDELKSIREIEQAILKAMDEGNFDIEELWETYYRKTEAYDRKMKEQYLEMGAKTNYYSKFVDLYGEYTQERSDIFMEEITGETTKSATGNARRRMIDFIRKEGNPYCIPAVADIMKRENIVQGGEIWILGLFRDDSNEFAAFVLHPQNSFERWKV
ncbi:MAG: hypothetical protein LBT50_09815 [Prevotellaceae bacterium]|nr:hypothetical protein [Prevotellaceae bacterium]